jgi:beta-lactamase regulating signal transducer with metallopeptidase domain
MNAILGVDGGGLWQLVGWTMLHFLWLGTAIGATALACRVLVRRAPANFRYVLAMASMLALAASPIVIAAWLVSRTPAGLSVPVASLGGESLSKPLPSGFVGGVSEATTSESLTAVTKNLIVQPAQDINPRPSRGLAGAFDMRVFDDVGAVLESCARYLPWLWLVGTPITFVLMTTGIVGAERLRRASQVIDDGPIAEACARVMQSMQISRQVAVAVCERIATPVLVGIVRPLILLPPAALTGWSPDEIEMVLLHELAHVRRWDNLVNLVQRLVESLLFFHPAVWLLSRWVRREREACCDAVVVGRTAQPHAYAELLVALAAQMPRSVLFHPAASSAMAAGPLRGRIRRILQLEDDPMLVTRKSLLVVLGGLLVAAAFAVLYVPSPIRAEQQASAPKNQELTELHGDATKDLTTEDVEEKSTSNGDNASTNLGVPTPNDQKLVKVPFVQGATRFSDGDSIRVLEVRGTAETFEPGNLYWIKGTYTLASHDKASLSAFTTAKDAANGTGPVWKVQTTVVEHGSGTFTLCLPMSGPGWPHISFYPEGGGESFGGVYFGTNDSVLKKWWGSKEASDTTTADRNTKAASAKFPSLEEQKLADLAWSRLGIELEPISGEDMRRVKAQGYDGGLRVMAAPNYKDGVWIGDILVGLHVWPTTRLKEVGEVLNRDDLAELNPLKFYVVRRQESGGSRGREMSATQSESQQKDIVVTGRISVNLVEQGGGRSYGRGDHATAPSPDRDIATSPAVIASVPTVPDPSAVPSQAVYRDLKAIAIPSVAATPVLTPTPELSRVETATPQPIPLGAASSKDRPNSPESFNKQLESDSHWMMLRTKLEDLQAKLNTRSGKNESESENAAQVKEQMQNLIKQLNEYRDQRWFAAIQTDARRAADESKRAAEAERREAEAAAIRGAQDARRAAEGAKRAADGASREAEEQKRDAESEGREAEERARGEQDEARREDKLIEQPRTETPSDIKLDVIKIGPERKFVGELAKFKTIIKNLSTVPVTNVEVLDQYDAPLDPRFIEPGGKDVGSGRVLWYIDRLDVGERREFPVEAACVSPSTNAFNRVSVTGDGGVNYSQQTCTEIQSTPSGRGDAEAQAKLEGKEAQRAAEDVAGEADAAKREAEAASREAEEQKRTAEDQERQQAEAKDPGRAEGQPKVSVTYTLRPSVEGDDHVGAGHKALEQLHRQLEDADRQLEVTKRQLEELVRQKETLVHQAQELTQLLQQQSGDKQQP